MKHLFKALATTCEIAFFILFITWLFKDISGWYWFYTLLAGVFFDTLHKDL